MKIKINKVNMVLVLYNQHHHLEIVLFYSSFQKNKGLNNQVHKIVSFFYNRSSIIT